MYVFFRKNFPQCSSDSSHRTSGSTPVHPSLLLEVSSQSSLPSFHLPLVSDSRRFYKVSQILTYMLLGGFVKLATSNPFDKPIIDPKFVTTDFDKFALREAVRAIKRFLSAPAWSSYVIGPYGTTAGVTDAELDDHVQSLSSSVYHPVGTAAMTAVDAPWGVVNPDLKLKGAEGLRIVDASVWPFLPNAHTQGPVYLLAEKAAEIILGA